MGSKAVLFYGVLLPAPTDEEETLSDILQRITGTSGACEQARSFVPCAEALAALGVEAVLVGADNDDNEGLALAVIGTVREGFTGAPSRMNQNPSRLIDHHVARLHQAVAALGLSLDTEGWYLSVASV
jgi:hypothetical protein